jgi:hypothetical protein
MVLPANTPHSITGPFEALLLDALRELDEASSKGDEIELFELDEIAEEPARPGPRAEVFFERLRKLDGYAASSLVDGETGVVLGSDVENTSLDIGMTSERYAELYRLKRKLIGELVPGERLDSMVLAEPEHFHVMHTLKHYPGLFIFVLLSRATGNVTMAQFVLAAAESIHEA